MKKILKKENNKQFKNKKKSKKLYKVIKVLLNTFRIKKFNKNSLKTFKKIYNFNFKKKISNTLVSKNLISKKIDIKVSHNNLFCTFSDLKTNKTLHVGSGGLYKIKISRRKFKRFYKNILLVFFAKIKKYYFSMDNTIFNVKAPLNIRKKVCRFIMSNIKKTRQSNKKKKIKNIILNFIPKKCFNGCRAKKKIRKKRRLYRIYK